MAKAKNKSSKSAKQDRLTVSVASLPRVDRTDLPTVWVDRMVLHMRVDPSLACMRFYTVLPREKNLIAALPCRQFILILESADRVVIEHPENMAFDPEAKGAAGEEFYVITGRVRMFSTFAAVSSVALADREGAAA